MGIYGTKNKQIERQVVLKFRKKCSNPQAYKDSKNWKWKIFFRFPAVFFQHLKVVTQHYANCYGMPTCYSDRPHDFSVTIPKCYKDVYVNDATARFKTTRWLQGRHSLEILFFLYSNCHVHNVGKENIHPPKSHSMFYLINLVWTLSLTKLS